MNQLFISYSRKDTDFARRLTDSFAAQNMEAWVDWEDIPPSVDWMKKIEKEIEQANVFVFLVSPDSIQSKVCTKEVAHAIKNGKRIIPVVAREVDMKDAPAELTHLNWIFFSRPQDKFEAAFEKLQTAIQTDFDWVQAHTQLQVKALEWMNNNSEDSFLLRGKELGDANAQLRVNGKKNPLPTDLQRQYILKSATVERDQIQGQSAREQQLDLEKKLGTGLRRLTNLLLGVFTVAYVALFFWLNTLTNNLAVNSLKDQMLALVETSVCFINVNIDGYQEFLTAYPAGDNMVYEAGGWHSYLYGLLTDIKNTNKNIRTNIELYTITQGKDASEYLIVTSTDNTINYKETYMSTGPGSAQIAGMEKTTVNTKVYADKSGRRISACSPIFNTQGISIGALCADFDAQLLDDTRQRVTNMLGGVFLAVYPAMIGLVLVATRSAQKAKKSAGQQESHD